MSVRVTFTSWAQVTNRLVGAAVAGIRLRDVATREIAVDLHAIDALQRGRSTGHVAWRDVRRME